jgi:hypothetical protein
MFWGIFLILIGGLILLDHWDLYYGGLISKLIIAGLIAWGGSILLERANRRSKCRDDEVGEGKIESTPT